MKVQNELAAKILSEIISNGMSMSDIDLSEKIKCAATDALSEIKLVMHQNSKNDRDKLGLIKGIMEKYNIGGK